MGEPDRSGPRKVGWLATMPRWTAVAVAAAIFVVMPDKVIGLLGAAAKLAVALVVAKLVWDHSAEIKLLLRGVVDGSLSLEALGIKVQQDRTKDRTAVQESRAGLEALGQGRLSGANAESAVEDVGVEP